MFFIHAFLLFANLIAGFIFGHVVAEKKCEKIIRQINEQVITRQSHEIEELKKQQKKSNEILLKEKQRNIQLQNITKTLRDEIQKTIDNENNYICLDPSTRRMLETHPAFSREEDDLSGNSKFSSDTDRTSSSHPFYSPSYSSSYSSDHLSSQSTKRSAESVNKETNYPLDYVTSGKDIVNWILEVSERYEECRQRIEAIEEWNRSVLQNQQN